jgi:hypothetical protein
MSVSIKYIAAVSILTVLSGTAAQAGCCGSGNNGGITNIPEVKGPSNGCCGPLTGHVVGVPGVFVPGSNLYLSASGPNLGGTYVTGGGTYTSGGGTSSYVSGGNYGGGVYSSGGGSYLTSAPPTPGVIEGAAEEQEAVTEQFQETRTLTETIAIRAVCIDDRGMPHPASRTDGEQDIAPTFNGEVFRCMAGTRMEIIVGKIVDGKPVFDGGRTMSCQKGQALSYTTGQGGEAGAGGTLVCVAQAPRADCNERSLLRRYGPGIKFATITRTETVTATRQASRSSSSSSSSSSSGGDSSQVRFTGSMYVDGGVGQGVF